MGGGGEATSYDGEKAWSSINHLILSGIGPHAEVRAHAKSSEEGHTGQVFSVLPIFKGRCFMLNRYWTPVYTEVTTLLHRGLRRKIRLSNAKCRSFKKLTCKGTLRQVFI